MELESNFPNSKQKIFAEVYGDESTFGNAVVYALVIVTLSIKEEAERALADAKMNYGVSEFAKLHCSELFHKRQRKKTEWSNLSDAQVFSFAEHLATSLAHVGVAFRVGFLDRRKAPKKILGQGPFKETPIQEKQPVWFAYTAAMGELDKWPGFDRIKFWHHPDRTRMDWFGNRPQAQQTFEMYSNLSGKVRKVKPEPVQGEGPVLLQVADFAAYIASHALSKEYTEKIQKFRSLYKIIDPIKMNPEIMANGPGGFRPQK